MREIRHAPDDIRVGALLDRGTLARIGSPASRHEKRKASPARADTH